MKFTLICQCGLQYAIESDGKKAIEKIMKEHGIKFKKGEFLCKKCLTNLKK